MSNIESLSKRQRGAALIVALVMLAVATGIAVSSFNLGRGGMQVVANAELDLQTFTAMQAAIEEAMSSDRVFTGFPAFNCETVDNRRCFNLPDGLVRVNLTPDPACVRVAPISNEEIIDRPDGAALAGCFNAQSPDSYGTEGAGTGGRSNCSDYVWEIVAVGTYHQHGEEVAQSRMRQGVGVVGDILDNTRCP